MSVSMLITHEAFKLKLLYGAPTPEEVEQLFAARRDTAAFQIIVNCDMQYSLTAGTHDWYTSRNHMFKSKLNRVRVAIDSPFPVKTNIEEFMTDDDGVKKTDLLLNQETRESDAFVPTAVWVETIVPEDAKAGDYTIKVKLYSADYNSDETLVAEESLPLKVFDYTLPHHKDIKFHLDLWQHNSNIARKHDVALWSDEHFDVIQKYVDSLAALGQKSITVCASEIPWCGQESCVNNRFMGNLYEYSMIGIEKEADGSFKYDYSKMQKYIDMCTKAGFSGDIEVIGIVNVWLSKNMGTSHVCPEYPEPIRLRYLDKADGCFKYIRSADEIKDYIRSLEKYFIETKQIERVRIAADEPSDIEKYRQSIATVRELAPSFRFKCAINHVEFVEEFGEYIDDYAPYLRCASVEHGRLMNYRAEKEGKRFLWYVCCGNSHPNTFIRSPLEESRVIGLMTSAIRFEGFLRWNYTVWPDDPRNEIRYGNFEAGDTNFVYPAYNGSVLLSLRYKNLQRGITDYELIEDIRRKKGDELADTLLTKVFFAKDVTTYYEDMKAGKKLFSTDWNDFNALKAEMLAILEK